MSAPISPSFPRIIPCVPLPTMPTTSTFSQTWDLDPACVAASTQGFFSDKTQPMLVLLIEATAFTALLIPILLCLLHSSTVFERRRLIWKVVVGELVLGLLVGAWAVGVMVGPFLHPAGPKFLQHCIPLVIVCCFAPWFVDLVLLLRAWHLYPRHRLAILAFPIAIKIARLGVTMMFVARFAASLRGATGSVLDTLAWAQWLPKIEWGLQIADNGYLSAVALWRLRSTFHNADRVGYTLDALKSRILIASHVCAANFIFPLAFNCVLFSVSFPSYTSAHVQFANFYVSLLGVVFMNVLGAFRSYKTSRPVLPLPTVSPLKAAPSFPSALPCPESEKQSTTIARSSTSCQKQWSPEQFDPSFNSQVPHLDLPEPAKQWVLDLKSAISQV